eukprot:362507-Chlamydomonas_euryale.AAC.11
MTSGRPAASHSGCGRSRSRSVSALGVCQMSLAPTYSVYGHCAWLKGFRALLACPKGLPQLVGSGSAPALQGAHTTHTEGACGYS